MLDRRRVFFVPLNQVVTIDDDLIVTRASYNQVNTISARKAEKEGNFADVLSDALFLFLLVARFQSRGEKIV